MDPLGYSFDEEELPSLAGLPYGEQYPLDDLSGLFYGRDPAPAPLALGLSGSACGRSAGPADVPDFFGLGDSCSLGDSCAPLSFSSSEPMDLGADDLQPFMHERGHAVRFSAGQPYGVPALSLADSVLLPVSDPHAPAKRALEALPVPAKRAPEALPLRTKRALEDRPLPRAKRARRESDASCTHAHAHAHEDGDAVMAEPPAPSRRLFSIEVQVLDAQPRAGAFACSAEGCEAEFGSREALESHFRVHTRERPFKCRQGCDRRFSNRNSRVAHEITHTDLKPFECPTCHRRFNNKSNMRRHQATHSDARPYKCPVEGCGMAFKQSSNMVSHARRHERR